MESSRSQELKVGLLMTGGITAIILIILWVDPVSFSQYYEVTAYLDNAGGLRSSSPVTLSGINIGEVVSIGTNNDRRGAIKVRMKIDADYDLYKSSELRLLTSGIFGDSYLEFGSPGEHPTKALKQDGTAWAQVSPGLFDELSAKGRVIADGLADLMDDGSRQHIKKTLAHAESSAEQLTQVLSGLDLFIKDAHVLMSEGRSLLTGLKESNEELRVKVLHLMSDLDTLLKPWSQTSEHLAQGAQAVLQEGKQGLAEMRQLMGQSGQLLEQNKAAVAQSLAHLQQSLQSMAQLLDDLKMGRGLVGQLFVNETMAKDVNDAIVNTKALSERLADEPQVLLWGQTDEEKAAERQRRKMMRARRMFEEGYRRRSAFAPQPVIPVQTQAPDVQAEAAE